MIRVLKLSYKECKNYGKKLKMISQIVKEKVNISLSSTSAKNHMMMITTKMTLIERLQDHNQHSLKLCLNKQSLNVRVMIYRV